MSTIEVGNPSETQAAPTGSRWYEIADRQLDFLSDYLNPILVKETRQALKSRQFAVTFALVLLASWLWSLFAIYMRYPGILYSPDGPFLLIGYYDILLFPLVVIIPFSAYRSLASERDDGTFELLSISTLSPRQIIMGKLISSILQMIVYLSALAPCIGFTYLLRGIDIITITYVIAIAFFGSVLLSAIGLVLSCATSKKHWQSALTVVVILLYLFLFFFSLGIAFETIYESTGWRQFDNSDFWLTSAAVLSIYLGLLCLVVEVAAAQITFESENRAAGIRITALIVQFVTMGWFGYFWIRHDEIEIAIPMVVLPVIYWFVLGVFMNGESDVLSPRILRSIPSSIFGRWIWNWKLQGGERGYFFAVNGLLACYVITLTTITWAWSRGSWSGHFQWNDLFSFATAMTGFAVVYLSVGRLTIRFLNLFFRCDVFISSIIHMLWLLAGIMLPMGIQLLTNETLNNNYPHWSNPLWFFVKSMDNRNFLSNLDTSTASIVIGISAALLVLLNLLLGTTHLVPLRKEEPTTADSTS